MLMEQYLQREKELLELTNADFYNLQMVVTNWYSVKNEQIVAHNKLVNAMAVQPDYLILSRYETDQPKRRITVYFNREVQVVPFIPFGEWKLFDNTEAFGRHKYYTVQDPTGVTRTIALTEHIPYIYNYLKHYLKYSSFATYDKSENKEEPNAVAAESSPIEIILEPGKSYLVHIKEKQL